MRYYVEINGVSSLTIQGLAISELPSISKPLIRTQREEIDGRDGDIITKLGYSAYDKTLKIGLWGNYNINEVIAFFNTDGKITFSNEPNKYYYFTILNRADFINQLEAFRTATITIHCQPFKYMEQESPEFEREYIEKSGTSITWDNSLEHAIKDLSLKGNTSQTGTPTPSSPIPVNVVSGDNSVVVCGKNILPLSSNDMTLNIYINNTGGEATSTSGNYYGNYSYIPFNYSNKTITLSTGLELAFYDNTKTFISYIGRFDNRTQVVPNNTAYIRIDCHKDNINEMQIELNSTATTYEPYNGTTYNIDLPVENLCNGINQNVWISGSYDLVGIGEGNSGLIIPTNGGKYTISTTTTQTRYRACCIDTLPTSSQTVVGYNGVLYDNTKRTFTIDTSGHNYLAINATDLTKIQIEEGTKANSYTPYGTTPIELNKIGTYQDYIYKENDKWYLHKETWKTILGVNNVLFENRYSSSSSGKYYFGLSSTIDMVKPPNNTTLPVVLCDKLIKKTSTNLYNAIEGISLNDGVTRILVYADAISQMSLNDANTWLSSNNLIIYGALATPTNTEITYTPLIEQLNTLEEAQSKEGTTNINQVNNDLPFIITASVLCGTANLIVNNLGNIIAKPVMTITGSGDIGVYLNGSQIFNIALGDEEYITIDIPNMEAHKDDTLKNRLVVGDYNSFVLQPGENTISFTGDVSNFDITNYSRWI